MKLCRLQSPLNLALVALLFLVFPHRLAAEVPAELVIGTSEFRTDESFLESSDPAHRLIRQAVTAPLLVPKAATGLFTLIFADSFQVDAGANVWSYRIREGMTFSNGEPVGASDVCYSLLRCSRNSDKSRPAVELCEIRAEGIEGAGHSWVDVKFSGLPVIKERQKVVVGLLAKCPVLEQHSSEVFTSDLAVGTNILASGDFQISAISANKSVQLQRFQRDRSGRPLPRQVIEVRGFNSMNDALAALRVGTVGMFLNTDPEVERIVQGDETLRIADCGAERVVYRRGFQFSCADDINLSTISWELAG